MPTPPFHTAPPHDADDPSHLAFQEWECRRASVVAVALLCAKAWREGSTPIAGLLDRLGEVTSIYEEADAALQILDEATRKRPRSHGVP